MKGGLKIKLFNRLQNKRFVDVVEWILIRFFLLVLSVVTGVLYGIALFIGLERIQNSFYLSIVSGVILAIGLVGLISWWLFKDL